MGDLRQDFDRKVAYFWKFCRCAGQNATMYLEFYTSKNDREYNTKLADCTVLYFLFFETPSLYPFLSFGYSGLRPGPY